MSSQYHMVEYFSGHAQVSAAFREKGMAVASYDVEYCGKPMNFLECGGYAMLSCKPNSKKLEIDTDLVTYGFNMFQLCILWLYILFEIPYAPIFSISPQGRVGPGSPNPSTWDAHLRA